MEKNLSIFSFISPCEASTGEQRAGRKWGNPAGAVPVFPLCSLLRFVSPSCELSLWLSSVTLGAGALAETANCSGRGPLHILWAGGLGSDSAEAGVESLEINFHSRSTCSHPSGQHWGRLIKDTLRLFSEMGRVGSLWSFQSQFY